MKRTLPRKLRDRRQGLSPYTRQGKTPYKYAGVPLRFPPAFWSPSPEAIAAFEARKGIKRDHKGIAYL